MDYDNIFSFKIMLTMIVSFTIIKSRYCTRTHFNVGVLCDAISALFSDLRDRFQILNSRWILSNI